MVTVGSRVVVRHRRPPGSVPPLTDTLGVLEALDPVVVRTSDGRAVTVAGPDVVALKVIPARPVRTRDVRALEHAAALGWPGTEHAWLDDWLLRAGHGFTGRGNSCVPLGPVPEDGVARVRAWYAERGLVPRFVQPDRLAVDLPGWSSDGDVAVLTAELDGLVGSAVDVRSVDVRTDLDDAWLGAYHYRGGALPARAPEVLRAAVGQVGFARIERAGQLVAVARGAVTEAPEGTRWLGLTAVEVAPGARRQGLGRTVCAGLAAWGAGHAAQRVYLQVSADNEAARALYAGMGFAEHHRYRYAVPAA